MFTVHQLESSMVAQVVQNIELLGVRLRLSNVVRIPSGRICSQNVARSLK